MPKTEREFERIRSESRDKIVDTAITVFAKKGYAAATISDIAEAAGISVGLMYRYFHSKKELFETIAHMAVSGLIEAANALSADVDPKLAIESLCCELISEMGNEGFINLNMMMTQCIMSKNSPLYDEILHHDKKMFDAATNLIEKGQKEGVFAVGSAAAKSAMLFAAIQGMAMMKFFFNDDFKTPSVAELTAHLYI